MSTAKELKAQLDRKEAEIQAVEAQIAELTAKRTALFNERAAVTSAYRATGLLEKQAKWKPSAEQQTILDKLNAGEKMEVGYRWRSGTAYYYWRGQPANVNARAIRSMIDIDALKTVNRNFRDTDILLTDFGKSKVTKHG